MIEIDCPLCGESQRTVLFPANFDTSRLDRQTFVVKGKARAAHYQINRCRHCGMVYSSPVMEHAALAGLYREFEHENTLQREIRNVAATSRHYYELARPYLSARGRALDVGCDIGLFLSTAQQDGFRELYGIEPNRHAAEKAAAIPGATIIRGLYEDIKFPAAHFDLISMVHVLDHLLDVNQLLSQAYRDLASGGVLIAVVHNVESLLGRLLGERFPPFNIQHNHFFSKRTLRDLFQKHGFAVGTVRSTWNRYSLHYYVESLPIAPAGAKARLAQWSDTLGVGRVPVSLPLGNIAVVARKPTAAGRPA